MPIQCSSITSIVLIYVIMWTVYLSTSYALMRSCYLKKKYSSIMLEFSGVKSNKMWCNKEVAHKLFQTFEKCINYFDTFRWFNIHLFIKIEIWVYIENGLLNVCYTNFNIGNGVLSIYVFTHFVIEMFALNMCTGINYKNITNAFVCARKVCI